MVTHRGVPLLLAVQEKYLAAGYPASPGGGPWLRMTSPHGEMASLVPSGCTMIFQPWRWIITWWWNAHYADLGIMPMPGCPALVAVVGVRCGAA